MSSNELDDIQGSKLPNAIKELDSTCASIKPITKYCKEAYAQGNQAEVYKTTVKYTGDVLTNLAYHSYNVAQQLTSFLEVQLAEVEKLNLILQSTSLRMQAMKEATGAQGLRRAEAIKSYQLSEKLTKLNENQLPANAMPIASWKRVGSVDYNSADSVNAAVLGRPAKE